MPMTARQKSCAERLTSLFENGTTRVRYAYAERLRDGRGITAGRAGFTTATGDAFEVVRRYCELKPQNPLAKYLPRLAELKDAESDDMKGLYGYIPNWARAAKDAVFRRVQDEATDEMYFAPSQRYADRFGLKFALSRAFLFDSILQHGDGADDDGLRALLKRTAKQTGGAPARGVDEKVWLAAFIAVRRADLAHAFDAKTRREWAGSVGRCDVFSQIAAVGNYDLTTPFEIVWEKKRYTIS